MLSQRPQRNGDTTIFRIRKEIQFRHNCGFRFSRIEDITKEGGQNEGI